ncbi:MAG: beta strand repeat-containing protein, partial [Acidimicrobiales bacterium]
TGNVEFLDGTTPIADCGGASGFPVDGSGAANCAVVFATFGDHSITAAYLGDTNFTESTSPVLDQVVDAIPTAVTASASPDTTVFGQPTTITAIVPPGATGTVTFTGPGGANLCTATVDATDGTATCDTTALPLGNDTVAVAYSGDPTYGPSSTTTTVDVSQASTTTVVSSSENPSNIGDAVMYTATVTPVAPGGGTPTGSVEFLDGTTPIADCNGASGEVMSGGVATCSTSYAVSGTHPITAIYSGDGNYTTSTSPVLDQVVSAQRSTTTASASPDATVFGQPTTITATVPPGATGTVTFTGPGGVNLCPPSVTVSGGTATCTTAVLPVGNDTVAVAYSGDATYGPSSTTTTVDVSRASTTTSVTSSKNPSSAGGTVTYTATVSPVAPGAGTPTGKVEFLDGSTAITACGGTSGTAISGTGTATCAVTYAVAGTHPITARYLGDTNFAGSTSTVLDQVVDKVVTTTTASPSPISTVFGQPTTITAIVTTGATGTVTFTGPGGVVLCTATVSAGTATCRTSALPVGTDTVTVAYSGDPTYGPSSTTTTVDVSRASTTTGVTSSDNPSRAGTSVTYTATVSVLAPSTSEPTGNVEFLDGTTPIATCGGSTGVAVAFAKATCTVTYPVIGTHIITAVYVGSTGFNGSTSAPITQTVTMNAVNVALTASANPQVGLPVTLTATVPPHATGTVTFTGPGGVVLCVATVSGGVATCVTTKLPQGPQLVTAAYSGDASYGASSTSITVTIGADLSRGQGYWTDAADGGIFTFGNKQFYGSTGSMHLNDPVVGMASTPDDHGYWLVATDGGVFAFGDAGFYGSTGSIHLNEPIEGIAPTYDGQGYWMVASDGGVFAFGDATFKGSMGGTPLNKPIVGMAPTPDGNGYWMVASDGGVFAFGDAGFYGSAGSIPLNKPIVAMASTPDGKGYWLVATDGGIFAYGDAAFYGSTGSTHLNLPIVGIASTPSGNGYWLDASDGGVFSFGDAKFWGSMGGHPLNKAMVGMSI